MKPLERFCWIAFTSLVVPILVRPLFAESFETRHTRDLERKPSDLHFQLDTTGGERGFHMGERIPLTLQFSSDSPEKYKLNGANYDRSGRLPTEEFVLEQEGVADPYQDYFGTAVLGGFGGGLRGYPVLDSKPYKIALDLNDWFRFDRPGRYRLYLKSHRLARERGPGESGARTVQFAAVSNIIEIGILEEDAAWETAKLREIQAILDQPYPEQPKFGGPPLPHNPLEEQIALARRELRYMATLRAVQLSFEHGRKTGDGPDTLLLIGARDRIQVITAFDAYLADPQVGIREWEIRDRALFTFLQKDAPKPLPMFMWQFPDGPELEKLQAIAEARQKRFEEIVREEAIRLIPIVAGKDAAARKTSGEAIASVALVAARAAGLVPPDDYGLSREELIAQFAGFPFEQQLELLGKKWDLVRGPEMIPALRAVIDKAKPNALPKDAMSLRLYGIDGGIGESALRRLAELAPQETARILRSDVARENPRFPGFAVRVLPAQDVPEADEALSKLLKTNMEGVLPLVARFATARLARQMRELYLNQSWPCAEEESFVSYFVRTAPGEGPGGAIDLLRRAMANRGQRGCYHRLLNEVGGVVWNSTVEAQAIATLDDSDTEAAGSAAQALAAHGGPGVEPFLWKRLERWADRWRGRAAELEVHPITGSVPNPDGQLGPALSRALASAKSWVLDESRRRRLVGLCVDDRCREQWGRERPPGPIPVEASGGGPTYPAAFRVEGYAAATLEGLKRKLQEFPAGTAFRWCPQALDPFDEFSPGQREEMFKELAGFLSTRSMSIEPYLEERCVP